MKPEDRIEVPDPARLMTVQKVGDLLDPFEAPAGYEELFRKAMLEAVEWHASHSDFYRKILNAKGFDASAVESLDDCHRIPFIPANFFKAHEIVSIPRSDVLMHFTSSGTTGQKSQIFFDQWSFRCGQRMVDSVFAYFDFVTPGAKTNYLLYSYETEPDSKLGTAYTDNYLCKYAPVNESFCALRRTGSGSHDFDVFGCIARLERFAEQGLPVRIFGFPAFLYFTLSRMRDLRLPRLSLPPSSLIFLGGGWKGHVDKQVPKEELYELVTERLGIPGDRIRDSFGAVEHPIPYSECKNHHFHVPVWSKVIIRNLRTLEPCGFGEKGFLQFLTPFLTSVPAHSVLIG